MAETAPADNKNIGYEQANEQLEQFVFNPALDKMAQLFGAAELPQDRTERLAALQQVAATHWDFRKGAERQATDWNDALLDQEGSEQWDTIFHGASQLNMVESTRPENKHPDYLVVLGGANKAPFDRLRYALGLKQTEDDEWAADEDAPVTSVGKAVVYLGSSRPVSDAEREKAKDYASAAQTEFDLGCGAFEALLGARMVSEDKEIRGDDVWGWREYEYEDAEGVTKTAFVLSTPQVIHLEGEQNRRATTYDNYEFFAGRADLANDPEATVVAVTTGFYVPGQHLPAVQQLTLPYGTKVETIGHDADYSGVTRKPSQLLQETKSAIDAAVRLEAVV